MTKTFRVMTVLRQKELILINDCGALYDEKILKAAILQYAKRPILGIKHIYLYGKYACVSINDKKVHIHRLIKEFTLNRKIGLGMCVHHKDGNRLNNMIDNLIEINNKEHSRYHNNGRKPSEKAILATVISNHKRKGTRGKTKRNDVTPQMVYLLRQEGWSFNKIAIKYNMDWGCVRQRYEDYLHDNPELLEGEK